MVDIFVQKDAQKLLSEKYIWILGDSNVRAFYKDIVWLLQRNDLIVQQALKSKLEQRFMNDMLINGDDLCRGRNYMEERVYINEELCLRIEFMFLTKCLTESLRRKLADIKSPDDAPDLIIINSCLWDICRWGPEGVSQYKHNIVELLSLLKKTLPPSALVIWITTPPVSSHIKGGFLIKQIEFMQQSARFEIMEGNLFVRQEVIAHGFDVLDLHYYLVLQMHRRSPDGIHWRPEAVRFVTNLILTHVALAWDQPLPGNFSSAIWDSIAAETEQMARDPTQETLQKLTNIVESEAKTSKSNKRNRRRSNRRRSAQRKRDFNSNNTGGESSYGKHQARLHNQHYHPYF